MMHMSACENKQLRWTFAIGLSLALHVVIVLLMAGVGGDDTPSAPSHSTPSPSISAPDVEETPKIEPPPVVPAVLQFKTYVVKAGDNLSKIAKLDGSTLAELAELNETDVKTLSRLQVGQKIKVKNGID